MAQKRNKRRNNTRKKNNDGILGPLIGLLFGSSTVALLLLVVLFAQTLGKASNQMVYSRAMVRESITVWMRNI